MLSDYKIHWFLCTKTTSILYIFVQVYMASCPISIAFCNVQDKLNTLLPTESSIQVKIVSKLKDLSLYTIFIFIDQIQNTTILELLLKIS